MSTHALASLTATYTDSEPEGDEEEEEQQQQQQQQQQQPPPPPPPPPPPQQQQQQQPSPPAPQEIDKEVEKEPERKTPSEIELEKDTDSLPASVAVPQQEISSKITKLVSYHDDNIISDEEGDYYYPRHELDLEDFANHSEISETVELPPEPSGRCSPRLIEKVIKLHEKIESGLDMNNMIQSRKDFRNPSIYEKLIQFCGLNELGTNYPASVYDPLKWGKESFYEELAKVQKVEMEKREKERKERTKVEFVSGTKKANSTASEEEMKKRKSKWDQVGAAAAGGLTLGMIRPAGLLQPSLTTSVTGTKGTVISAFGSLPKKPRI